MKTHGPNIAAGSSGRDLRMVCDLCGVDGGPIDHCPEGWWFDETAPVCEPAIACESADCRRQLAEAARRRREAP